MKFLLVSVVGSLVGSLVGCVPGLHVYNLVALVVLFSAVVPVDPELAAVLIAGMITGYSVLNSVPAVLLSAPDESMLFTVGPGRRCLLSGRGLDGILLVGLGSLIGLFVVVFAVAPLAPLCLPSAVRVFRPHQHWILWCVIVFMLMSEWPTGGRLTYPGLARFVHAWSSLSAGLATFVLSGLIGFVLIYRSPIRTGSAFQNLAPAFMGLFTLPWLIMNIIFNDRICSQKEPGPVDPVAVWKGAAAGVMGGGFAAFFPVVTGGVGGFLAGHAASIRDERAFMVSQGASRLVYYVGGILLFFVPGLHLLRGGGAWLLGSVFEAWSFQHYLNAISAIAISGSVSLCLLFPLARIVIYLLERNGVRRLSLVALAGITLLVWFTTGLAGILVMIVSAGTGMIPVAFGARRMNGLGVIMLPLACGMSGFGGKVAAWLGL